MSIFGKGGGIGRVIAPIRLPGTPERVIGDLTNKKSDTPKAQIALLGFDPNAKDAARKTLLGA